MNNILINKNLIDKVIQEAKCDSRKRKNFNLHNSLDEKVQRFINALEPETHVPIHRHCNTAETLVILTGRLVVYYYNDFGDITEEFLLCHDVGTYGINVPSDIWHSVKALETGTTVIEIKEGPYEPVRSKDIMNI